MKYKVHNQKAEEIEEVELSDEIFNVPMNFDLVHQIVLIQQSNRRRNIAKTKNRGEVSGGGKKPWRQKGTGRARSGSNRSPIWIGGGVVFGPNGRKIFKKKVTKKMKRKALFMVLSAKTRENLLLIIDNLNFKEIKTKLANDIMDKLFLRNGSGLVALSSLDKNTILSLRNIPKISVIQAKDLNVLDVLSYKYLVIPKEAIKVIEKTFIEKSKIKNQKSK